MSDERRGRWTLGQSQEMPNTNPAKLERARARVRLTAARPPAGVNGSGWSVSSSIGRRRILFAVNVSQEVPHVIGGEGKLHGRVEEKGQGEEYRERANRRLRCNFVAHMGEG